MADTKPREKRISFRVRPAEEYELKAEAERQDVTVSKLIRRRIFDQEGTEE